MENIPENIRVAARFILLHLQRTFEEVQPGDDNGKLEVLNQGLSTMAHHLPVILYNAGLTKTVIPASGIHCQLQNNLLGIHINDVGTFITDLEKGGLSTLMHPAAPEPADIPVNFIKKRKPAKHFSGVQEADEALFDDHTFARELFPGIPASLTGIMDNKAALPVITSFNGQQQGMDNKPGKYFIYFDADYFNSGHIDLKQSSVIRVHPED